ncbi:alcohol-forming fatty acyl-CoA reductase [Entomortierella parvispora]|uniref:Fatty acyl-CoA reductase n=1 Tax=Entomortierella parvispora TaxID=205924 RepID=A0A9P3HAG3_9FUNG|nr:alcohol-forming fatty acyl-CoA reductase [Entomortierella parvispora]
MVVRKVVPIVGDITLDRLGISDQDLAMIQHDTTVVIHAAGAVSFTSPLGVSIDMNLHGTLRAPEVAKGMRSLASFVHISTGYVNSFMIGQRIKEKIYPHPFEGDPLRIFESLCKMTLQEMDEYERDVVLKVYPNTYVFAKSLTEHLIRSQCQSKGIPLAIVRPTVVWGTLSEPVMGWSNGDLAANAIILSTALREFQAWCGRETAVVDLIPVDVLVKTILLSATRATAVQPDRDPFIAVAGTSTTPNPATAQKLFGVVTQCWQNAVPAPRKRVSNDIRNRIFRFLTSNTWYFENTNACQMDREAPPELSSEGVLEKGIDWLKYIHFVNLGFHEYVLKEKVDRTMVIPYQKLLPIQKTFASEVSKSSVLQEEDVALARL